MFRKVLDKTANLILKPKQSVLKNYKEAQEIYNSGDKEKALEMFKKIVSEDGLFKQARAQVGKISCEIEEEKLKNNINNKPK
jgi:exoribonuclease R